MNPIKYAGWMMHFALCDCADCDDIYQSQETEREGIERRALEYRNQTHCYQPDTQQDREEAMHQGVSRLPRSRAAATNREPFYLDQTYDMPLLQEQQEETEQELC